MSLGWGTWGLSDGGGGGQHYSRRGMWELIASEHRQEKYM